ncbi:MAG: type II secretion system protein GspD [Planctomycetota bacterium]
MIALAGTALSLTCAPGAIAQDELAQFAQDTRPIQIGQFAEPVELGSFVEFVSRTLDVNIILSNVQMTGKTVEFKAEMTVEYRDLIPLLDLLLAQHGFALSQTEQGWLMISPPDSIMPDFDGELATTRIFKVPLADPETVMNAAKQLLGSKGQSSHLNISSIENLGVIVSTAAPQLNKVVEQAINRVLEEHANQRTVPLYLEHIAANEARERLLQLVGQSSTVATPRPQANAPASTTPAAVSIQGFSNLAERLVADRASNALLFRGTEAEAQELRVLVALVDQRSRIVIRRYNAGAMSPVIASYGERQGLGPVVRLGSSSATQQQQFFGSGFVVEDSESGAFTYYGTDSQHDAVQDLVEEFADQVQNEKMVVEFYKLQNADAEEVATLINSLLDLESSSDQTAQSPFLQPSLESSRNISRVSDFGVQTQATSQPMVQGEGVTSSALPPSSGSGGDEEGAIGLTPTEGMAIIADVERNQLMVRAPFRQQSEIKNVIEQIDQRRPQVYLEVQIVTVNASDSFQLTIETALTDPGNGDNSRVPVFTNFGLLTDPNDVNSVSIPFADGFSSAIIDDDWVPLVVNALQTEGGGKVLSTPRMLVNDNETATINSTTNESFAQTTQSVGSPTQTSLGGQISAGTTMTVTPQISEGGFVTLELDIELSSFGERPNPDLPPNTRSDSVQTVVTTPVDSTVVVGGLTFQSESKSVSKIPLLGDIPILGHLFRSQTRDTSDRTLYVFITPRVLLDPTFTDLRLLTRGPAETMEIDLGQTPALEPAMMSIVETRPALSRGAEASDSSPESGAM